MHQLFWEREGGADKSNGVNELSVIPEDVVVRITDGGNQSMS